MAWPVVKLSIQPMVSRNGRTVVRSAHCAPHSFSCSWAIYIFCLMVCMLVIIIYIHHPICMLGYGHSSCSSSPVGTLCL